MLEPDPADPTSRLTISTRRDADGLILAVEGQIDFGSADELRAAVEALRPLTDRLTIDLTAVTFFDSSGVRALLEIRAAAVADTGAAPHLAVTANIDHVLELSGVRSVFGE